MRSREEREAHTEPERQNWEELVERPPHGWERYARAGALTAKIERLDAEFDVAQARTAALIDAGSRHRLERGALAKDADDADLFLVRGILGPLAMTLFDEARRLAGTPELQVAEVRRRGEVPFGSVGHALEFLTREIDLGIGAIGYQLAEDREEDLRARSLHLRRGRALPETFGAAGAVPIGGWLPADFMPVRSSRSSTGRVRGEDAVGLRVSVLCAVRRSKISRADFGLLFLADVGEPRKHVAWSGSKLEGAGVAQKLCWCGERAHRVDQGYEFSPTMTAAEKCRGWVGLARLRPAELAARLNAVAVELEPVSAEEVGHRLKKSRDRLAVEMEGRRRVEDGPDPGPGLIPRRRLTPRRALPEVARPSAPTAALAMPIFGLGPA